MSISFKTTKEGATIISSIVDRACAMVEDADRMGLMMDITACHANGMPLDLERLRDFPDFDFAHDVFGIYRHLDRSTGELGGFFVLRCAKPE